MADHIDFRDTADLSDLELARRLRALHRPSRPDPARKARLRARLVGAPSPRPGRLRLQAALLPVLAFCCVLGPALPLQSHNPALSFIGQSDRAATFETVAGGTTITLSGNSDLAMTRQELEQTMARLEEFALLHMAGETEIRAVMGSTLLGRTGLTVSWHAQTTLGPESLGMNLPVQETAGNVPSETVIEFYETRYADLYALALAGHGEAVEDTILTFPYAEIRVQRSRFEDEEFGPVTIWFGRRDPSDHRGVAQEIEGG